MRLTRLLTTEEVKLANDYSAREERKHKLGDYTIYNNVCPFDVENKLGEYENIDESPEHLAKVSKAFEIIKEKKVNICCFCEYNVDTYKDYIATFEKVNLGKELLTQEEYNLLKEVLL